MRGFYRLLQTFLGVMGGHAFLVDEAEILSWELVYTRTLVCLPGVQSCMVVHDTVSTNMMLFAYTLPTERIGLGYKILPCRL